MSSSISRAVVSLALASQLLVVNAWTSEAGPAADAGEASLLTAVAQSPALQAARARVLAAQTRIESAGRFADPEIEGMASRANMPDENRTMWEMIVRQPLPKRGERAADRERARAAAAMAEADYAMFAGEVAADVAMALAEAGGARTRADVLATQIARLEAVLRSVEVRLAAGTGRIADRLTVQTRIASMQLMIEEENRMAADALAAARGRLGLDEASPLPEYAAPAAGEIAPDSAPALRAAGARGAEAAAMADMARASANPMTAVGLRFEREETRMGAGDTIGLAFMSEIPWRSRRYSRVDARAAEADRAAAAADAEAARYRIAAALSRVGRAERLAETARRLGGETRARLDAEYDSLLRAAGAAAMGSESTVLMAVEILEKAVETELQVIQSETAARIARAELWRYAPVSRLADAAP